MKKLMFACLLMAIGMPSFAQWTGTTNIYNTYTAGNVGIGVTNPHGKLTVGGGTNPNPNTGPEVDYAGLNLTFMESTGSDGYDLGIIKMVQPTGFYIDGAHMTFNISSAGKLTERMRIDNHGNIGFSTIPAKHSGYTALSINNPASGGNGGYLDFMQAGVSQGYVTGDADGLSLFSPAKKGVHVWSNGEESMTFFLNGKKTYVGINALTPYAALQVRGTVLTGGGPGNLDPGATTGDISFLSTSGASGSMLMGWNRAIEGESDFISNRGTGNGGYAFWDYSNTTKTAPSVLTELMRIRSTGEVLIGVNTWGISQSIGTGNKLAVGGGIITDAVTVKLQKDWADYVFKPGYVLPTLESVKSYIDKNHHLPEIPSEAEIKKDGQNLGEMNRLLVKKVEELTLYTLNSDKQIKDEHTMIARLQTLIEQLQQLLKTQQREIDQLKKAQ